MTWVGQFFGAGPAPITGFTLDFYQNNQGAPGALLATNLIPGDAAQTLIAGEFYSYSATLPSSFAASSGTEYWMSIVPNVGFPSDWSWQQATGGDELSYQQYKSNPIYSTPDDVAFSLATGGTAVPELNESGTGTALSLALGTLLLVQDRRKRGS